MVELICISGVVEWEEAAVWLIEEGGGSLLVMMEVCA